MDNIQNVRLYQSDYDKIKKIATENNISMAEAINQLIVDYERLLDMPHFQRVHMQM